MRTVVWYRDRDLRVSDHLPLLTAVASGDVIPLFVLDPDEFVPAERPHATQFLLDALDELAGSLAALGSRLLVVEGRAPDVIPRLAARWRADRVVAYRRVDPSGRARDELVRGRRREGLELHDGETLLPPGSLRTGTDEPYTVFSAFARSWERNASVGKPLPAPSALPPVPPDVDAETVPVPTCAALGIPRNDLIQVGGERAAKRRLERFLRGPAAQYDRGRDRMDVDGTSRMSADLRFGTTSVRAVWAAVTKRMAGAARASFRNELLWREFTYSTLYDRPELLDQPFRPAWVGFPWRSDTAGWDAWTEGRTGYPLVDAAARQLLSEGFVHNRARMIAASFLTKHLMIDYRHGEAHYMRLLTDGDPAQNNAGWQWSAGCGTDAQPWFRIFNPVRQGMRFDPEGGYVRRWVPELAGLPAPFVHRPWEAKAALLDRAGVRLGRDYPFPIVDHALARERYLRTANAYLRGARD